MGFDLTTEQGLPVLEGWTRTRSYLEGFSPSQADVVVFNAITYKINPAKFPQSARWFRHISSFKDEFHSLPGDPNKPCSAFGPDASEDDEDIDLFGSDDEEEDAEAIRIRDERLAEYTKKKAGKVKPAAKSLVTLEVKPWDDETDLAIMESNVRAIDLNGLVWGASKLVEVGFGIKKLQINLVVEDEKVSIEELQERIEEDEDHVQSTDVAAMQKL